MVIHYKWKQIKNNIKDFVINNKFYIVALLIFLIGIKLFLFIYISNIVIVLLLLPFIFIFIQLWVNSKDNEPVSKNSLLTVSSIILVVIFFLFSSFQVKYEKYITMGILKARNCNLAKSYSKSLPNNPSHFGLSLFLVDWYQDNYAFLFNELSASETDLYLKNIDRMERTNTLVNITQNNISLEDRIKHNDQISTSSNIIYEDFCEGNQSNFNFLNNFIIEIKKLLFLY